MCTAGERCVIIASGKSGGREYIAGSEEQRMDTPVSEANMMTYYSTQLGETEEQMFADDAEDNTWRQQLRDIRERQAMESLEALDFGGTKKATSAKHDDKSRQLISPR